MSQTTPSRSNRAGLGGSTAVRGGILVVGALFIGVLLMVKGGGGSVASSTGNRALQATTTTAAPTGSTTTPTTPSAATPPAALKIVAANGSTVKGLAGKTKTQLAAAGYTSVTALDTTSPVTSSIIYYVAGSEADAKLVARAGGFSVDRVAVMPAAAQVPVQSIGAAKVVILLGPDAPAAGAAVTTTAPRQVTTTTVK